MLVEFYQSSSKMQLLCLLPFLVSGLVALKPDSVAFIKDIQSNGLSSPLARITGGVQARPYEFPYQVAIRLQSPYETALCGGSLISSEYILTAAHCIDGMTTATIYLGVVNLYAEEQGRVVQTVNKDHIKIHEEWDSDMIRNDIALIKLAAPVEFSESIRPINLPKKSEISNKFEYETGIASGWGVTSDRIPALSALLRYVPVTIIENGHCKRFLGRFIHQTNICVSGAGGRSTCSGDSGGPLVIIEEDYTRTLVGITSFGTASGCQRGSATAFTRVSSYLNWIAENANIVLRE